MDVEAHTLSISKAAAKLGVSISYLRLTERLGVVPAAQRSSGGHRRYSHADLEELKRLGVGQRKNALAECGDG